MTVRSHEYTDDLGEMDTIGAAPVADFLPSPAELAEQADTVKVTLTLSRDSIHFFKAEARRHNRPYQAMIRALLDAYVRRNRS
jgi:predicted DNA binding CopG/RHH family protein